MKLPYWELFSVDAREVYYVDPPHPHHPRHCFSRDILAANIALDGSRLKILSKVVYYIVDNLGIPVTDLRSFYDKEAHAQKIHPFCFPTKLREKAWFTEKGEAERVLKDLKAHIKAVCERIPRDKRIGSSIGWVDTEPVWTKNSRTGSTERTNPSKEIPTEIESCEVRSNLSEVSEPRCDKSVSDKPSETQSIVTRPKLTLKRTRNVKSAGARKR